MQLGLALASQANVPTVQTGATALVANVERSAWMIQNVGTNALYVCLGAGASTSQYHVVLKASTGAADGSGGIISMEAGTIYTGLITVAGTSPSYVVTELGTAASDKS